MKLRKQKLLIEPPTSAAPDIAFILMIFFLVCASTQPDNGRPQDIPRAEDNPENTQEENVEVGIARNSIMLNGTPVLDNAFPARLGSLIDPSAPETDRIVVVKSNTDTPYERWIDITSQIEKAGGIITLEIEETVTQMVE